MWRIVHDFLNVVLTAMRILRQGALYEFGFNFFVADRPYSPPMPIVQPLRVSFRDTITPVLKKSTVSSSRSHAASRHSSREWWRGGITYRIFRTFRIGGFF
jgi:hypothetical protein